MKVQLGISEINTQIVANELGKVLADETVLYIKTKNAHWNAVGVDIYENHDFFDSQLHKLDEITDSLAERIRAIGHYAPARMVSYLSLTHLSETKSEKNDSQGFIKELLIDHENIIIILREHLKTFAIEFRIIGIIDFLNRLIEIHEQMSRFLRANITS